MFRIPNISFTHFTIRSLHFQLSDFFGQRIPVNRVVIDDHDAHHDIGFVRKYIFSTDHKVIGIQYGFTALVFLMFGFLLMMCMRWQIAHPGQPIPVVGGLRLTGKVGRNSLALLNMQVDTQPAVAGRPELPSANYSVFRYGREFLSNSSVGAFFMDKERGATSNRLGGLDLRYYPRRTVNIDGMLMRSTKTGVDDGTAWRAGIQVDPGRTQYILNYTSLGDTFRDELGFIPRQGVNVTTGTLMHRFRPAALAPRVREIRPQVDYVGPVPD